MSRAAAAALAAAVLLPSVLRSAAARPWPTAPCPPDGRGVPPRHWVGCTADPGAPRALDGPERLAFGRPVDVNLGSAADLEDVPGLTARLAEEVVADRQARGRFRSIDELVRVRGIGPARLARARPYLVAGDVVAE
jgi:competence protein ComEA